MLNNSKDKGRHIPFSDQIGMTLSKYILENYNKRILNKVMHHSIEEYSEFSDLGRMMIALTSQVDYMMIRMSYLTTY